MLSTVMVMMMMMMKVNALLPFLPNACLYIVKASEKETSD